MAYNVLGATPEVLSTLKKTKEFLNKRNEFVDQSPSLPPGTSLRVSMGNPTAVVPARVKSR